MPRLLSLLAATLVACTGSRTPTETSAARTPPTPVSSPLPSPPSATAPSAPAPIASAPPAPRAPTAPTTACQRIPESPRVTTRDGATEVFVGVDRTRKLVTVVGEVVHQDLCISRGGGPPVVLLAGKSAPDDGPPERTLADFDHLVFSRDEKTLYFSAAAWVTSSAAHAVDLASGTERFLVDGAVESEIESGPYAGMLLASHFRLDDKHPVDSPDYQGRIEMWSVITKEGKEVRRLPADLSGRRRAIGGR